MSSLVRGRPAAALMAFGCAALFAAGCGGGGGGAGGASGSGSVRIRTTGGDGTAGDAGSGGSILLLGRPGGDVVVTRDGTVDASFQPPGVRPYVGINPRIFTASAALTLTGDPLMGSVNSAEVATGLVIRAGATVTLHTPVPPTGTGDPQPPVELSFENGVVVEGALRTGTEGIRITADNVHVAATGEVASEGFRESTEGLSPDILFGGETSGVALQCRGTIVNEGRLSARGVSGETGGAGGALGLVSANGVFSTGTLDVSGGEGTSGAGGNGGSVFAFLGDPRLGGEGLGFIGLSGEVLARGGDGATAGGAGGFQLTVNLGVGSIASSATIDVSGGAGAGVTVVAVTLPDSEPTSVTRSGGPAGAVFAFGPSSVRMSGEVRATGGASTSQSPEAEGGAGGTVLVTSAGLMGISGIASGSILLSVDIDTRGGAGVSGGPGGPVLVFGSVEGASAGDIDTPALVLAGYAGIDASGGASVGGAGGTAAGNLLVNLFGLPLGELGLPGVGDVLGEGSGLLLAVGLDLRGSGGDVTFDVDVTARGGASTVSGTAAGTGGNGPLLLIGSLPSDALGGGGQERLVEAVLQGAATAPGAGLVAHAGEVRLEGGAGAAGGLGGSFAALSGRAGLTSQGEVSLGGGAGAAPSTTTPTGGRGGLVMLVSQGPIERDGAVRASGGEGGATGAGGEGGVVVAVGARLRWVGDVTCEGGGGDLGGAGGNLDGDELPGELGLIPDGLPEDGGIVFLSSEATSDVAGALSVRGGDGTTSDGAQGRIVIDGHETEPASGAAVLP